MGGEDGQVYSILLDSEVAVNSRFVKLAGDSIHCPADVSTYCVPETGTYFGQVGVLAANGDRLEVWAGAWEEGFARVTLNGEPLTFVEGAPTAQEAEHRGHRQQLRGADGSATDSAADASASSASDGISVQLTSSRSLSLTVGLYAIRLDVVDNYVDFVSVNTHCWHCLLHDTRPEGLLGRTWDATVEHPTDEAAVDRYRERDGQLLRCSFPDLGNARQPQSCTAVVTVPAVASAV